MSTLAVIPARLGASRLPRKPLRHLGGVPLVIRVWERATAMHVADRVVVATDAEEVVSVCRAAGAEVVLTRPDHPSGTDRIAEVAAMAAYARYSVIVNVQGDEPHLPTEAFTEAAGIVERGDAPLATAACRADASVLADANVVKVVVDDAGRALYFSRAGIPHLRDAADAALRDAAIRRHLGVYAYSRDALAAWVALPPHALETIERLEQLRPLAAGIPMGVATIDGMPAGGIDTEHDLAIANASWSRTT